ncbi:glycoside hydrolase [Rhizobium leguminosarum]|uniref:Glycoside hydrolase n=2 Tax=Rhizobium leguminosarum TaxID=384 RepID=A0A4Q8XNU3_RHILE|nr:glycoside hydrolase [Rhizobium leguminosarum]
MKYSGIALKIAVVCTLYISVSRPIGAEESTRTEDSWTALPDDQSEDTSRGAAFAEHEVAAYDAAAPASSAEPLAIPSQFTFPDDARYDRIEKHDRMNTIFGIDVSHYTDSRLNLDDLKVKNVRFVYIKATQGTSSKDAKFGQFWDGMGKLDPAVKVPRGAYHFLSSTSPGKPQADAFVDYITLHGGIKTGDLPPVVDLEWDVTKKNPDQWIGHSADEIVAETLACLKEIETRTHRRPILYTAKSWWSDKTIPLSRVAAFKDYPIWIADYNPKRKLKEAPNVLPNTTTAIWQFSDAALIKGQVASYDTSVFYGTSDDFEKTFGLQ